MLTKKQLRYLVFVIFAVAAFFVNTNKEIPQENKEVQGVASTNQPQQTSPSETVKYKVKRVVDGDTIELENGLKVRYIGIDTPETVAPNKPVACFGKEASAKNKELVEGKEVTLVKDVSETDRYGRLLRYVYVGNIFVNEYLVKEGYATAVSYPPDISMQQIFRTAEQEARVNNKGLWGYCPITTKK